MFIGKESVNQGPKGSYKFLKRYKFIMIKLSKRILCLCNQRTSKQLPPKKKTLSINFIARLKFKKNYKYIARVF